MVSRSRRLLPLSAVRRGGLTGVGAMDLLAQYSDDDGSAGQDAVAAAPSMKIDAAPEVSGADPLANKRRTLGSLSLLYRVCSPGS